jgi:hypothetical protein
MAKGYVVRGKDRDGNDIFDEFESLDDAVAERLCMIREEGCSDVRIYAVAEDGSETALPTYEEALAEIERLESVLADVQVLAYQAYATLRGEMAGDAPALITKISALACPVVKP